MKHRGSNLFSSLLRMALVCASLLCLGACFGQSPGSGSVLQKVTSVFQTSGNSPGTVPAWSLNYAFGLGKPHNSFAIVTNTLKAQPNLFGVKPLSGLVVAFAGTQLQTPASGAPQGLTGGVGGELAYQLGGNLFASAGIGYAASAGQQTHFYWLLGGSYRF